MTILNDFQIEKECLKNPPLINPFILGQVRKLDGKKIISYGLSSFGYDLVLSKEFFLFRNYKTDFLGKNFEFVDTLDFDKSVGRHMTTDSIVIPPGGFVLGKSQETFNLPRDIIGRCYVKSTIARSGLYVGTTI